MTEVKQQLPGAASIQMTGAPIQMTGGPPAPAPAAPAAAAAAPAPVEMTGARVEKSILQLRTPEHTADHKSREPPSHMASQDGAYTEAWKWFQELDVDQSGCLDRDEVARLMRKCKIKVPNRDIKATFSAMDVSGNGVVTFEEFATWWNAQKEAERRRIRRNVKEVFDSVDADDSGRLDKAEFAQVAKKAKNLLAIDPPFNAESDWELVAKRPNPATGEDEVTYQAFEGWWKGRLGIVDADIPVLPEYMVQKIDEAHYFARKQLEKTGQAPSMRQARKIDAGAGAQPRSAEELWGSLRPRLLSVVRMQRQWGPLHDLYDSQQDSRFDQSELPRCIRDPESSFSAVWDLTQVFLLLYVAITVPLRAGFSLDVELWSVAFFVDLVIDLYFITDICLNFSTAYYKKDGTREDRCLPIAANYMRGWFFIDLVSTLPVSYVPYFVDDGPDLAASLGGEDGNSQNFRAMKALRLVRLSKMLRLARIKKILMKYGDNVNLQTYISVGFTMFTILFLVHLLTCFFYMVGVDQQVLPNGVIIPGWVMMQEGWEYDPDLQALVQSDAAAPWAPVASETGVYTRYITATYLVLNALEAGGTTSERGFALLAELMRDFILGMVAGLMTTISMAMNGGEQESQWKLRSLKGWMQKNNLPKSFQIQIAEYCHELWQNRSGFNVDELFADVPPTMRVHLKQFLYASTIGQVPLFRGLSKEVIGALCSAAKPMYALAGDTVMQEGQPGRELYMLMSGELEVFQNSKVQAADPGAPRKRERLGFLSEGAFFGEAAVLADESGRELRRRTLKAVTDSELCYLEREDILSLRQEYPELDARLKRFVNVGNIRLSKKGGTFNLFPELSPVTTGMTKAQAEREQRRLVGEYATSYTNMQQMMKTIEEDGVAHNNTVSLHQLGVEQAKQAQQKVLGTATTQETGPEPLVPQGSSSLADLPRISSTEMSPAPEKLQAVETQLDTLQKTVDREVAALHSKSDSLQRSLQAIIGKLDQMDRGS